MHEETVTTSPRKIKSNDQDEAINVEIAGSDEDIASATSQQNVHHICSEDDIGVMLDYQPPDADIAEDSRSVSTVHTGSRSRRRRRPRRTLREICGKSWVVHFVSGIFTGLIFLVIGIVFVIYFANLPNYIGVLFILLSIPPFCMSINKYRIARQRAMLLQRARERRRMLRERRNNSRENSAYRSGALPISDMPPSYNNLVFIGDVERGIETIPNEIRRNSTWSTATESALPSYIDAVETEKWENQNQLSRKSSVVSESDLPQYDEYDEANKPMDKLDISIDHETSNNALIESITLPSSSSSTTTSSPPPLPQALRSRPNLPCT